jgi:hypothetical protein
MKKIILPLLCLAIFSCKTKDNNAEPANTAGVMFVNGCAGSTNLNATANGTAVATNLSLGATSGYKFITAGTTNLAFTVSGINSALVSGSQTLTVGNRYSVFAGGLLTDAHFVFSQDDLSAPASGNAKVRFVNLCPDNAHFTVNAGTQTLDSGIAAFTVTGFHNVTAGQMNLRVGDPTNISTVMDAGTKQMDAGKCYTLMLTGTTNGSGSGALKLTFLANN